MMIEDLFAKLPQTYRPDVINQPVTIYFSVGDVKKTVFLTQQDCSVVDGKTTEQADCVCITTEEFLQKVWAGGYQPGVGDFISGKIRSNNPAILQSFLSACRDAD